MTLLSLRSKVSLLLFYIFLPYIQVFPPKPFDYIPARWPAPCHANDLALAGLSQLLHNLIIYDRGVQIIFVISLAPALMVMPSTPSLLCQVVIYAPESNSFAFKCGYIFQHLYQKKSHGPSSWVLVASSSV